LILSGVSTCVIPLLSRPLLQKSANALNEQQFLYLIFLFFLLLCILSIPMLILGMINPISIYFYNHAGHPFGNSIGSILSSSTLGSFAGTFIPVFFLIPQFGTSRALIIIGFLLIGLELVDGSFPKQNRNVF
jgi:predicted membrane-bound spermidine synthase